VELFLESADRAEVAARLGRLRFCALLAKHGFHEVRRRCSHVVMQKKTPESTITVSVPDDKEIRIGRSVDHSAVAVSTRTYRDGVVSDIVYKRVKSEGQSFALCEEGKSDPVYPRRILIGTRRITWWEWSEAWASLRKGLCPK
jgi:predicted RNA binding protein YcfA (HicA-like mRNA interferase family)